MGKIDNNTFKDGFWCPARSVIVTTATPEAVAEAETYREPLPISMEPGVCDDTCYCYERCGLRILIEELTKG